MANNTVYPYGTEGSLPSSIGIINDLATGGADKALSAQQGVVLDGQTKVTQTVIFDITNNSGCGGYINVSTKKFVDSSTYYGIIMDLRDYQGWRLNMTFRTSTLRYAFLTSRVHINNEAPSYCSGCTLVSSSTDVLATIPSDCKYIYIYVNSDGTNVSPASIQATGTYLVSQWEEAKRLQTLKARSAATSVYVNDLAKVYPSVPEYKFILTTKSSNNNGTWYDAASNTKNVNFHKAIPVNSGDMFFIEETGDEYYLFYGFVTSSYSKPTKGSTIPYAAGQDRRTIQPGKSAFVVTPSDAAYLIVNTVNGDGGIPDYVITKVTDYTDKTSSGSLKIRYAHWNIGHFAMGAASSTAIAADSADEKALAYRKVFNDVAPDILGVCEDDPTFALDNSTSLARIYGGFQNKYQGTKYNYMCASLYFKGLATTSIGEIGYTQTVQANRYYKQVDVSIYGRTIKVAETHLDWDQGSYGATYRAAQIQELISAFANDPYVIISGDFNVYSASEYATFEEAGYTLANVGAIGQFRTYPSSNITPEEQEAGGIDNILVKGFTMAGIGRSEASRELSDHILIYCDLVMNI